MNVLKRKSTQNVRYGEAPFKYLIPFRLLIILACVGMGYFVYSNWQDWLERFDSKPITAYALVGKTEFTDYADVHDVLLKMGTLKGFWGQDVKSIQTQLETLPWVKGAVVRKIWPNRLSIWLTEYTPVAIWNKTEFVTKDGTVFQLPMDRLKNQTLPYLGGPDYQSSKVLEAWNQIYSDFKAKNLNVKGVTIDDRGAWQVTLDNDIVLKLGRGEWQSKLERFVTIYPQIEVSENKRIDYVDLRYKSGAAVGMVEK
ncbi:cell division protein FtsQ/DivIB [Rodentibacter heidelbergensis]|uniref:Cell division protein FtsQ n=1 Tax=Rodentibacter heidelbergensis TaxID=1908258 RepID=A0A1V3I892_9PAST|nr:cell division protein FtsQ/DivIB [Rodentibacter heidelbergensis]OOF36017.1 cell division protein FtsQ [Rodentibacter heidelbergensis]